MTSPKQSGAKAPAWQVLDDLMAGAWRGQALAAAVELDLFSHIAEGNGTASKIGTAAGASEHGTRRLLDALSALGYLKKTNQTYRLTPAAAAGNLPGRATVVGGAN